MADFSLDPPATDESPFETIHPPRRSPPPPKVVRPVPGREALAVLLLIILADLTIYRGQGYAGLTAFLLAALPLFLLGSRKLPRSVLSAFLGVLILLAGMKLVWAGSPLLAAYGIVLLVAFVMEISGRTPFLIDVLGFLAQLVPAGFLRLDDYFESAKKARWMIPRTTLLQFGLPAAAVLCFGGIFVLANPDVSRLAGDWLRRAGDWLGDSLSRFAPSWGEMLFWLAMAWIFAGLFKPILSRSVLASWDKTPACGRVDSKTSQPAALYPAFANTLVAVILLFAGYLTFEFQTLWLKEFPPGFYYSGYAHEGAAWLTIALALATVLLSLIFRADVLRDPRLPRLRRLAWIWSALNLCLAVAVYHRLLIYVGFNGMTRMRVVGFLGITAVVAGFVLVVRKITAGHGFLWLVRRQLWVLAFAGFLYAAMPVDALVHRYNVQRILAGDPAPSVQISVHPMNSGGALELLPLLNSDDPIIREGVRAMLAQKALDLRSTLNRRDHLGWTSFQRADQALSQRMEEIHPHWSRYETAEPRHAALRRFHEYAYQWY